MLSSKDRILTTHAGSLSRPANLIALNKSIDVGEAKRLASNVDALNLALRGISNSDTRLR